MEEPRGEVSIGITCVSLDLLEDGHMQGCQKGVFQCDGKPYHG